MHQERSFFDNKIKLNAACIVTWLIPMGMGYHLPARGHQSLCWKFSIYSARDRPPSDTGRLPRMDYIELLFCPCAWPMSGKGSEGSRRECRCSVPPPPPLWSSGPLPSFAPLCNPGYPTPYSPFLYTFFSDLI